MPRKPAGKKPKAKAAKGRARAQRRAVPRCAVCGLQEQETRRLLTRGEGKAAKLALCDACVRDFARELGEIETPEPSKRRGPPPLPLREAIPQVPAPAEICGWQKFKLEGKKLEWRAERTVVQAARLAVLVHVRRSSADRLVTLHMHPGSRPTREDAERAGQWLLSPPAEDPELSEGPEAYGPLGGLVGWQRLKVEGQQLEWSAERAYVYEATPYVQIEVREYRSANRATTYFDFRTEPTLEHAIAAARELWSSDAVSVEI
jgi:hypothetical protein